MKKLLSLVFILTTLTSTAQFCPDLGPDQVLPCGVGTTTLTADLSACVPGTNPNETTDYGVAPIPYVAQVNTGTNVVLSDDSQSGALPIGFDFCFFGNTYTQFYIGSNGWISFNPGTATTFTSATIPSASPLVPNNCIMGPWQDWNPGVGGQIRYETQGTAPCRKLIVSWLDVPMYSCTGTLGTFHIVIHESTNLIENFIENKQFCAWAGGTGTQGIHNLAGTIGITVPGRNSTVWTATNEAYAYTPSGAPVAPVLTWYEVGVPGPIGTGPTMTVTPPPGGAQYTCHFEYPVCNAGWNSCNPSPGPGPDTVLVVPTPPLAPPIMTFTDPTCNGDCDGTATITPVVPAPGYTYLWAPTGDVTPTITGLCAGTYTVTADDGNGCITTGTVTLTDPPLLIAPPIIAPPIVCYQSNSETYFVAPVGPGITYTWVTTGTINSGQGTDMVDLDLSTLPNGTNTNAVGVFITDANGCVSDTVFVDVEVLNITPTIDPIGPFCSNDPCVPLVGNPVGGVFSGIVSTDEYCPDLGSGDITYTYIQSGCVFDTTISVISNQQPTILNILPTNTYIEICETETFPVTYTVDTDLPGTTEWSFEGNVTTSNNLNIIWDTPGAYNMSVIHYSNGCPSEIYNELFVVAECPSLIYYIPNAFTPDGDPHNQTWQPVFTKGFDPYDYHMIIFNRWGEVIWESYNSSVGWDGTYNGSVVQSGTYVWKVDFGDSFNDARHIDFGTVTILR